MDRYVDEDINNEAVDKLLVDALSLPIVGKVKMATVDFYTSPNTKGSAPTPVFSLTHVTPYNGAETGQQNVSYTHFVPGTPPATKFEIAGMATCPQAKKIIKKVYRTKFYLCNLSKKACLH